MLRKVTCKGKFASKIIHQVMADKRYFSKEGKEKQGLMLSWGEQGCLFLW